MVTPEKDALLQGVWSNIEARKSYLLKETEDVLFKHASWWVMDCKPAKLEMPTPDSRQVTAMVAPPAVVIFEDARGEDLLRTGFLIIEVNFCPGWRMDDQLLFNELFRYWREPYKAPRAHSEKFGPQISSFLTPFRAFTPASSSSGMDLYGERWMSALLHPLEDGRALIHSSTLCPDAVFGSYADDRAFVWTRAVRENQQDLIPGASIEGKWIPATDEQTGFRKMFGYWGKLLNVDQPSLHWDAGTGRPNGYNPQSETNGMTHFE
ncbi:MAG: hypothetical protein WCR20_14265, partial [Verrucomicrobiota bacterium]